MKNCKNVKSRIAVLGNDVSGSSIMKETLKSSLDATIQRRKVASECKNVTTHADGTLETYHQTLACILANSFLYGTNEEKGKVSESYQK